MADKKQVRGRAQSYNQTLEGLKSSLSIVMNSPLSSYNQTLEGLKLFKPQSWIGDFMAL